MTAGELGEKLQNGLGTKIMIGVMTAVFSAAALGAFSLASEVTAMRVEVNSIVARLDRMDKRITYQERRGYRHPAQDGGS